MNTNTPRSTNLLSEGEARFILASSQGLQLLSDYYSYQSTLADGADAPKCAARAAEESKKLHDMAMDASAAHDMGENYDAAIQLRTQEAKAQ